MTRAVACPNKRELAEVLRYEVQLDRIMEDRTPAGIRSTAFPAHCVSTECSHADCAVLKASVPFVSAAE